MDFLQEKIKEFEKRRLEVYEELRKLDRILAELKSSNKNTVQATFMFDPSQQPHPDESEPSLDYSKATAKEAIVDFLKTHRDGITTKEILDGIIKRGFLTTAKNKFSIVYTALISLRANGYVINTKTGWTPTVNMKSL